MISFGSSISALRTLEAHQAVASTSLANNNINDLGESSVRQNEAPRSQGSRTSRIEKMPNSSPQFSETKLEIEIPEQMIIQNFYKANASVIKTQDEMIGSIMDVVS